MAVKIISNSKNIEVYYRYDELFIEIMREHRGWWNKNKKCWTFPRYKKSDIYDALKSEKFLITMR